MTQLTIGLCIVALILLGVIAVSARSLKQLKATEDATSKNLRALRGELERTLQEITKAKTTITHMQQETSQLENQKIALNQDVATAINNIEQLKNSFETTEDEYKKKYMAERKTWLDERQSEYLKMQEDFVEQFREDNRKKMEAAQNLTNTLDQLKAEVDAATEVAKRHAERENFIQFHSLQLGQNALNDIRKLEDLIPGLSTEAGEAIAKVIWKLYYEKPYTDLVGRVIGPGRHTGIYRITNITSQMCYVGQAVDIADRWRQHIKRALNAEPRTQNKLYPAMYKEGLEHFTFEIIEECDSSQLNDREDYWQEFYHAKDYGYSIK